MSNPEQNRENWRVFRRRNPANFMSPKARLCRVNRAILELINRTEAEKLLVAFKLDQSQWKALCDEIEARFIRDGVI